MLPFRRTFEGEKHELQELNNRLAQYLSRTKQLEDENACLITEMNALRQAKTTAWDKQYKSEMRDLRRMVGQLSLEKSQAEMEREKLWRDFHMLQSLCREETEACQDIGGQLRGCEEEIRHANQTQVSLEQRLLQLENECKHLEEQHRQDTAHLRRQLDARVVPIITQSYQGPPVVSMEDVQQYARGLSEGWMDTFEMYQQKVEEMEQSVKSDRERLDDLQKEKMLYASEFDKLRVEAEKQSQIQMHLEEQLLHMQDKCRLDFSEYQRIIEQLEYERNMLTDNIAEKAWQHQQLLKVKMDLGMEVAAYRALLEGERVDLQESHRRGNQHQRERIIDIKVPSQTYTPRMFPSTRHHLDVRYTEPSLNLRKSPVPTGTSGSVSPSRVIPISVAGRARHQSPSSRRDMVSFTKAQATSAAAAAKPTANKPTADKPTADKPTANKPTADKPTAEMAEQCSQVFEEKADKQQRVQIKEESQADNKLSPIILNTAAPEPVKMVSPPMMNLDRSKDIESKTKVGDEQQERGSVCVTYEGDLKGKSGTGADLDPSEKKILDSVTMEDIINKVMRPAGLAAKVSSTGNPQITYHVEKLQQEDGSTKTQITVESKVEEELDVSEDSALDALLSGGVKHISLEDIKGTATGTMIQELLSGLQAGEDLANKSVNVEIIEQPLESHSDEEYDMEQDSVSKYFQPSSTTYCQIEEIESASHDLKHEPGDTHNPKVFTTNTEHGKAESVRVEELSRDPETPYVVQDEEAQEYFVSTPDDNLSEPDEGGVITSYGHYGNLDDLSDERYYQDERPPQRGMIAEEFDEFMPDDKSFTKESFPECIIEEEVHVSPTVQESVLEFLKEDSLDPKEKLKGALDKIQGSVSGQLKDELAYITRLSSESPQNLAVDVKQVRQTNDDGTMTIVAELNISQSLSESELLEEVDGCDVSEEQVLASLKSSNPELETILQGGAQGYSITVSEDQKTVHSGHLDDTTTTETTERYIKLSPSEETFTFQMDVDKGQDQTSSEQVLHCHNLVSPVTVSHEKRVTTIYLETADDTADDQSESIQ